MSVVAAISEKLGPKRPHPDWISPMLATLTDDYFSDEAWIYERKLDGERILAYRNGAHVRLLTRNRKRVNEAYPEVCDALRSQRTNDFVVDGEVVAFEGGVASFARLQQRMQIRSAEEARRSRVSVYYCLFDILHVDGYDVTNVPLRDRKELLRGAIDFQDPLRFSAHRNKDGMAFLKEACEKRWEGLIAKRADSLYESGRSRSWLKFKCVREQEFVICGYTDPAGSRVGFGALLVGYFDDGRLRYAGKVGTGYDLLTLKSLRRALSAIERDSSPFDASEAPAKAAHWVEPKVVAQIAFTEWTRDGKLRHPSFRGLRRDKEPREVTRERPS
jgi:DNA ligase D-like protein (predicted ligase)